MVAIDPDLSIRLEAFKALSALVRLHGPVLRWEAIANGFHHGGKHILFANRARGIFRPTAMTGGALSVKKTVPRTGREARYDDQVASGAGHFEYEFQGDNVNTWDNRRACRSRATIREWAGEKHRMSVTEPPRHTRSRARRTLYSSVLLLGIIAVFEGGARFAEQRFDILLGPFEIDVVPDVLGFEPQHEIFHLDRTSYANEGGYNGAFRPTQRSPRTLRIAVLGDSFTFGWGVQADQAWPALLEEALGKELKSAAIQPEVLNFGVPGYNTWLQLLHWREVVVHYKPDVVLLGYYSNDAVIDRRVPNVYKVCSIPGPVVGTLFAAAQERSALVRVAHDLFWIARDGSPLSPWEGKDVLVEGHYGFQCSLDWAEQLAREVTATGTAFAVVQLPHMDGLDDPVDPERSAQERLEAALEARALRTDNLYPRLAGKEAAALNNRDAHPNVDGNRAILEAVWPVTGQWLLAQARAEASSPADGPKP